MFKLCRQHHSIASVLARRSYSAAHQLAPDRHTVHKRERELILSVLNSVPSPREARNFLNNIETQRQAIEPVPRKLAALVFVDGQGNAGKQLAQMQRLGVSPVVLVSSGLGYREKIHQVHQLSDAIEREGGRARPINESVFRTEPRGISVDAEIIGATVRQGQIPLVSPLVADELRIRVLDTHGAMVAMARELAMQEPLAGTNSEFSLLIARLIHLSAADGVRSSVFHRFVNLQEDYREIAAECPEKGVLELMRACLEVLPPTAAGIVASVFASPSLVLKGLISERPLRIQHGAGPVAKPQRAKSSSLVPSYKPLATYPFVRMGKEVKSIEEPQQFTLLRHGFRIARHKSLAMCSEPRLRALLESSFKRILDGRYFDRLRALEAQGGIDIIIAGDYQGAVIVTHELGQLAYLDKFAVHPSVQGTGMADILWAQLRLACPSCLWRSRNDNAVNKWYFDRSDGHSRAAEGEGTRWVFFWYQGAGHVPMDAVQDGICAAQCIPPSFV
ncbi:Amino-acid acetyltransferase, mitochondrial [Coemansia spiralis]|uniref:Amino-acid acetyltransferase, mitochondrial n=2 Tax=Coemansia TaxID=4863 RepID=A0A9W8G3R7_9FUNG|nr:Amino-acid acetyltransferase, mitochondrial [Coemansia umbellata]KAJ2620099.1 Amino-acid acetyltransferase, mitochondrial [Coemansia sp. RSA 1358]KAJ2672770.1 Amino-acid acetyltransferase, mitochondrial [Coemansia spiralis]